MSIPSWARKGAKVVCISVLVPTGDVARLRHPKPREIVTIEEAQDYGEPEGAWLWFEEYPVAEYDINDFRPLVDDANDAEIEREIYRKRVHQNVAPVKALERT